MEVMPNDETFRVYISNIFIMGIGRWVGSSASPNNVFIAVYSERRKMGQKMKD